MFIEVSTDKFINVDIIAEIELIGTVYTITTKSGKRFNYWGDVCALLKVLEIPSVT